MKQNGPTLGAEPVYQVPAAEPALPGRQGAPL